MSNTAKNILAFVLLAVSFLIFSAYKEPLWGAWLPRFLYLIPRAISGEHPTWHFPGMLAMILSVIFVGALALRDFLPYNGSVYWIIMLLLNAYVVALIFEIVFGDTTKFLQGGVTTMAAVLPFIFFILGRKQDVSTAVGALGVLCVLNILSAEQILFIPGAFGIGAYFGSIWLQCDTKFKEYRQIYKTKQKPLA